MILDHPQNLETKEILTKLQQVGNDVNILRNLQSQKSEGFGVYKSNTELDTLYAKIEATCLQNVSMQNLG